MDARDLKVFEAVARHGRMSQAATELNTVQSNVTAQIRRLEEELGVALFERHARGVTLAPPGRRLLPYAKKLAAMVDEARRAALDDGTPRGSLVVGALETTTALRLSPLLNRYVGAHPNVDLSLRTGTTCELVDRVRAGELEGAFVCGPIASSELEVRHAFTEELVLLTGPRLQSLDDLERTTTELRIIVLRAGCSYRQRLEEILARRGIVPVRVLEFGSLEAILGCVAAGLGVTLLPGALVDSVWRDGLRMHALPPRDAQVETLFIHRRDGYCSSALRAFLDVVLTHAPTEARRANDHTETTQRQSVPTLVPAERDVHPVASGLIDAS